jgi:hypothetical protein
VKPGDDSSPADVPLGAPPGLVRVRASRKTRSTREPTPAPDSTVRVRFDAPAPRPGPGACRTDSTDASVVAACDVPAIGIDDEMHALFAKADRIVSHVDPNGRQFVAAAARLSPDDVEAIAQRLAALFLRGG